MSKYLTVYMATLLILQGDGISPLTDGQTAYVICVVIVGSCINASLFASVARLTAQMSERRTLHARKMDRITMAMRQLKVHPAISKRVAGFYEYLWTRHSDHMGSDFIASLPLALRTRVACNRHEGLLRSFPLFRYAGARDGPSAASTMALPSLRRWSQRASSHLLNCQAHSPPSHVSRARLSLHLSASRVSRRQTST